MFNKLKKYYSYQKLDSPDFEKMVDQMKNEIFRFQKKQKWLIYKSCILETILLYFEVLVDEVLGLLASLVFVAEVAETERCDLNI